MDEFDILTFLLGFMFILLLICVVLLFVVLCFSIFAFIRYGNTPIEEIPTWVKMLLGNKILIW